MLYHKYDPQTLLYVESVEAKEQPDNSVAGVLPDQTEHYTLAFINGQWASVLRPEIEIVGGCFHKIVKEELTVPTKE